PSRTLAGRGPLGLILAVLIRSHSRQCLSSPPNRTKPWAAAMRLSYDRPRLRSFIVAFSWLKATPPEPRSRRVAIRAATRADARAVAGMASALSRAEGGFPSRFTEDTYARDGF